jgi:lysophospholipase L1-like esterase
VWIFDICAILGGVCVYRKKDSISIRHHIFFGIMLLLVFVSTVLCDIVLGLAGFPSELQRRLANPPNYKEIKKSIGEYEYEFVTNSQGLRYKEIPLKKTNPGEKRIFLIGDSYTEGVGVKQNECFSSLLEEKFRSAGEDVYFINGGLGGTGPVQQMRMLFDVGIKYDPDVVLICVFPNDLYDTTELAEFNPDLELMPEKRTGLDRLVHQIYPRVHTIVTKYKLHKKLTHRTVSRDIIATAREEALLRGISEEEIVAWTKRVPGRFLDAANKKEFNGSILVAGLLRRDFWTASLDIDSPLAKQKMENMKSTLDLTVSKCRDMNIDVRMVLIPCPFMFNRDFHSEENIWVKVGVEIRESWLSETTNLQKELEKWAASRSVPLLDMTETFRKTQASGKTDLNHKSDGHWNAMGHKTATETIGKWLDETNLLDSQVNLD